MERSKNKGVTQYSCLQDGHIRPAGIILTEAFMKICITADGDNLNAMLTYDLDDALTLSYMIQILTSLKQYPIQMQKGWAVYVYKMQQ